MSYCQRCEGRTYCFQTRLNEDDSLTFDTFDCPVCTRPRHARPQAETRRDLNLEVAQCPKPSK